MMRDEIREKRAMSDVVVRSVHEYNVILNVVCTSVL